VSLYIEPGKLNNKIANNTENLVLKCSKGNKLAQYQLFKNYFNTMFIICNRIIINRSDAEEIVQDAFVNAFLNIKKLKSPKAFGAWLKQIVINKSINFIKRNKRFNWVELPVILSEEIPYENAIYKFDNQVIADAVSRLSEGCRIVFLLHLIEGYKHREIAEMLKISESTSKSQYQRAKSILKENLSQIHHEE